jgi:ubiquinone/menaquinone biosynthesis C-methylase UbiE
MKVRDSGMPAEGVWDGFFDARRILTALGFGGSRESAVDFGCGYGTFTVAAARLTTGTITALDIDPTMIAATRAKVSQHGLKNVIIIERDFVAHGTGLGDTSVDWAMLFNILHADDPLGLLRETHRILRPGGKAGVIHWNCDASTPRGPSLSIRPRPEQCREWLEQSGFDASSADISLPPFHFGIVGVKISS